MKRFTLWILDRFQWLFKLLKTDYGQLRAIVGIKLTMDNRRQTVSYRRKESKEPKYTFFWVLFMYAMFGIVVASLLFTLSFMTAMTLMFSCMMVTIAMTVITDFSSILLDTSENTILLPRPVDGRTMFVARITHICIYLLQLTLAFSIFPATVVFLKFGGMMLFLFAIAIVLSILTSLFITNGIYLLIMQFASDEKLKNIINYFQILMAVIIMGGYQLLPRMMNRFDLQNTEFKITWWSFLVPPVWMAGALDSVQKKIMDNAHLALTILAVVIPVAGIFITSRFLTPLFNRKLAAMGTNPDRQTTLEQNESGWKKFLDQLASVVTGKGIESGAFKTIYRILGRDRKLKLKIYPALGYTIIFLVVFLLRSHEDVVTTWRNLPHSKYYVVMIYFSYFIIQTAFTEIIYSDDFKASWIYYTAPIDKPGEILSGMLKAIFIKLFVPVYLGVSALIIFIWGPSVIDDLLLGFVNCFIILLCMALIGTKYLPLSMSPSVRGQSGNFVRAFLSMLLMAIPGLLHWALTNVPYSVLICLPIQIMIAFFLLRWYQATAWYAITS